MTSLIQSPKTFRQIHFDSLLIQIDLSSNTTRANGISVSSFSRSTFSISAPPESRTSVIVPMNSPPVVNTSATFQLKRVKGSLFRAGNSSAAILISCRCTFQLPKCESIPRNFMTQRPCCLRKNSISVSRPHCLAVRRSKIDATPGFEDRIVFKRLLDSDFAFQTLGFRDPSDGNVRRLPNELMKRYSRISSVNRFFSFIPAALRMVRIDLAVLPLLPDDFAEVALSNSNSRTVVCSPSIGPNGNLLRIIHESFRNLLDELLHSHLHTRFAHWLQEIRATNSMNPRWRIRKELLHYFTISFFRRMLRTVSDGSCTLG